MHRISGPITDRLIAEYGRKSAGWSPTRDAALRTNPRPAAAGWSVVSPARVRRIQRRRLRAVLVQVAAMALLAGGVLLLAGVGEVWADHRYDGVSDRKAPGFCYVASPPPGVARCHGANASEVTR